MSNGYLQDDKKIFYVLNKVAEATNNMIEQKDLEKIIIELDEKGFTLTDIKTNIKGLTAPYLRNIITDYRIYRILSLTEPSSLTDEGREYIKDKIADLDKDFAEKADSVISKYYFTKDNITPLII